MSEFLNDFDAQLKGERIFEVLSQIILDICTHISSRSKYGVPDTYADCINRLHQLKILNKENVETLRNIIKMRNVIVHQYTKIDHELLYEGLKKIKHDFKTFQKKILKYVEGLNH